MIRGARALFSDSEPGRHPGAPRRRGVAPRFAAALLVALAGPAASAAAGVIHRWSFAESGGQVLRDRVGGADGRVVSLAGGGKGTLRGGRLLLDGGDPASADHAVFPAGLLDAVIDRDGDFTIKLWAMAHSFPAWGRILSLGGPGAELSLTFSGGADGTDGGIQRLAALSGGVVDVALPEELHVERCHALVWEHAGGANGAGRLTWCRDGAAVTSLDVPPGAIAALRGAALWLGRPQDPASQHGDVADASWDELRIHDEALSPPALRASAALGPDPEGDRGLLHRWSFEEHSGAVLRDSIGGADGRIVVQAGPGGHALAGGALRLEGGARETSDYASFPGELLAGLREVTIELWATPRSFQSWGHVFSFSSGSSETGALYLTFSRGAVGTTQRLEFEPRSAIDSSLPTEPGVLYHYVVTWDDDGGEEGGSELEWYRDGVRIAGADRSSHTVKAPPIQGGLPKHEELLAIERRREGVPEAPLNAFISRSPAPSSSASQGALLGLLARGPALPLESRSKHGDSGPLPDNAAHPGSLQSVPLTSSFVPKIYQLREKSRRPEAVRPGGGSPVGASWRAAGLTLSWPACKQGKHVRRDWLRLLPGTERTELGQLPADDTGGGGRLRGVRCASRTIMRHAPTQTELPGTEVEGCV